VVSFTPGRFTPRERAPVTHWIGGWVEPRAVLDAVVKRKIHSLYIKEYEIILFPAFLSGCEISFVTVIGLYKLQIFGNKRLMKSFV
jgi:hypothetical protein